MHLDDPLIDDQAPPVAEGEHVPGGSGLLKAQAICPAWAYYRYRLGAKKLNTPREGLDSATRGTLVHDALCHFWRAIPSLAALKACSPDALSRHIQCSVDQALGQYNTQPDHLPLSANEQSLESDRLCKLLKRWIAVEQGRVLPFQVVETEKSVQVTLEGLDMRLQIDRIDELEDGRWIIMDYKTGRSVDFKNWASTRITEPQLPLYAVMSCDDPHQLAGVVFGKVRLRNKEASFAGLTAEADLLPSVDPFNSTNLRKLYPEANFPDWSSVLHHWQTQLHRVAHEVREGVASVTFENESALQYCDVLPLLRLTERQLQQETSMRGDEA
jgi:exodeoxyribonuclease-5